MSIKQCGVAAAAFVLLTCSAAAQNFPQRPVRIVVPVLTGGGVDLVARQVGQKLGEAWNQQVIVDNRAGAGGVVGSEIVAKAVPDGHTLMVTFTSHVINPSLHKLPYDTRRDFTGITQLITSPNMLALAPQMTTKTLQDFIALARSKPGELSYASTSGIGSLPHLIGELLCITAGLRMTHVPYKGMSGALPDVAAGRVPMLIGSVLSVLPHVRSGRLRVLAVTSAKRVALLPDAPTFAESGYPGFEASTWYGAYAPARTAAPIMQKLNRDFVAALQHADVRSRIEAEGAATVGSSLREFDAFIAGELDKWAKVIKTAGIKAE